MDIKESELSKKVEAKIGMTIERYVEIIEAATRTIEFEDDTYKSPVDTSELNDEEMLYLMKRITEITTA